MSRVSKRKVAKKDIFIVTEGESEEKYFSRLKQLYRGSAVKIKKINPCDSQIITKAKKVFSGSQFRPSKNSKGFVVIDKDKLSKKDYDDILTQAKAENITVIFSNTAFEVWLLAHFEVLHKGILSMNSLKEKLTNHLGQEYKKADKAQIDKILKFYHQASDNTSMICNISYENQCTNVAELCKEICGDR